MLLLQVVEPLVTRHDDLQGAIARMRVGFPAIEAGYRPGGSVDLCVEPDDDHAPCLLAAREAVQLSGDQILDFDLGLGELVHMLSLGFSFCLPAECPLDFHKPAADGTARQRYEAYEDGSSIWTGGADIESWTRCERGSVPVMPAARQCGGRRTRTHRQSRQARREPASHSRRAY